MTLHGTPGYAAHLNVTLVVADAAHMAAAGAAACVVVVAAASLIANGTPGFAARMSSLNSNFSSGRLLEETH